MNQTAQAQPHIEERPASDSMPVGKAAKELGLVSTDGGQFSNLMDVNRFEHVWRIATLFASSKMVPVHYQDKPADCFIACQMAIRLGVDPFMFMQNTYIVHGRPGMEAKLAIALINSSGLYVDSLDYEIGGGEDPFDPAYRVRAYAVRKSTGKTIYGPWIDWKLVRGEGWDKTNGSKWKTMPGQMFQYRAGTFFGRLHCPERLMGMQTADEIEDVGRTHQVENTAPPRGAQDLADRLTSKPVDEPGIPQQAPSDPEQQPGAQTESAGPPTDPTDGPAPAEESPNPHLGDELVKRLANKAGCTLEESLDAIDAHCQSKWKKSLPDVATKQRTDVEWAIDNDKIKV